MDGLLLELEKSGVGCYMGGAFAGASGYADDLKLLTPSVKALHILANICEKYANKYDVMFNGKKSMLIIYKCTRVRPPDPNITINNVKVPRVDEVIHLGHHLSEDIYKFDTSKCVSDFNKQCNMFFAHFKHANSHIRNILFHKYCTSFYGSQVLPMFDKCINNMYTAWRIAIRRVWRVPWTTHCILLPHLAECMDIELWFSKRCIRFLEMSLKSKNRLVRTITNMGINGFHSVMGRNFRMMDARFGMNVNNVCKEWEQKCKNENDADRLCVQIRELCEWRDKCDRTFLNRGECKAIVDFLCTS